MGRMSPWAIIVAIMAATAGCGLPLPGQAPARAPAEIVQVEFARTEDGFDERVLLLTIAACNAGSTVSFTEEVDRVLLWVEADRPGRDADGCADEAFVELQDPLGARPLVNASTNDAIPVVDPETGRPINRDIAD